MPYSFVQYSASGSNAQFAITFPYINRDHVEVSIDGVEDAAFTFVSDTIIQTSTTPSALAVVDVRRVTPKATPAVDFSDSSVLTAGNLDILATQFLYLAQEAEDAVATSLQLSSDGTYDADNHRISMVQPPVNDYDAVPKIYADAIIGEAETAAAAAATAAVTPIATAAAASASAASTSASAASTSASTASTGASTASTSASAASTSATAAAASATAAAGSATTASTQASNASASATAAAATASTLSGLAGLSGTGLIVRTGSGTSDVRTITGTAGEVSVADGNGVSANPTISLPATMTLGTKALQNGRYQNPQAVVNALGSITGTNNVDLTSGSVITATLTGNTTLVFGNNSSYAASGVYQSWLVVVNKSTFTLTLQRSSGNSVTWDESGAPTLTNSKAHHFMLYTTDGGATVRAVWMGGF